MTSIDKNYDEFNLLIEKFSASVIMPEDSKAKDPFWDNSAKKYLSSFIILYYISNKNLTYNLKELIMFIKKIISLEKIKLKLEEKDDFKNNKDTFASSEFKRKFIKDEETIFIAQKYKDIFNKISYVFDEINSRRDREPAAILIVLSTALDNFGLNNQNLLKILEKNDFKFEELDKEKIVIYLITPEDTKIYDKYVNIFINDCYSTINKYLYNIAKKNSLDIRLNFILDEFANIPIIDNFDRLVSVGRSKNIRFTLLIQNITQLKKYGEDAKTIIGNCDNIVFLYSKEKDTLEFIHEKLGNLTNLSTLQKLSKENGEAVMILGRNSPYMAKLKDISEVIR